jgi:uncharacterized RmlC-like cupin family protein
MRMGRREIGTALSELHEDGTRDCERCGLPMMPVAEAGATVTLECANRHRATVPLPTEAVARERVRSWIARRGAQLHVQHERWEAEEEAQRAMDKRARLIRPSERTRDTTQTAGMIREEAVRTGELWAGVVRTEAGRFSSWHHHGEYDSVLYVIAGQVQVECGPGGTTKLVGRAGDCVFVPRGEIHREGNSGLEESEVVVFRSGSGDLVVNVAGPAA